MKKISEHLGELIIALAGIMLIIGVIGYFHAPIGNFFASIVTKEVSLGNTLIDGMAIGDIGVSGGENGGEADDPAEEPDNRALFYTYNANGEGYRLALTTDFRTAVNGNTDYVVDGETLWTAGSALPNPGAMYEGKPVNSLLCTFAYQFDRVTALDLSEWDTSNVTDMSFVFANCHALQTLDLTGWDTSKVTTMEDMFSGCLALTSLDVTHFKTANVTNMASMFSTCMAFTELDVSNFDVSNVTTMRGMFTQCYDLTTLDLSTWDTSNVTDMSSMFKNDENLTIIARTEADKARYEASYALPETVTITVK